MKRYLAMNIYIGVDSYRKEGKSYSLQLKELRSLFIVSLSTFSLVIYFTVCIVFERTIFIFLISLKINGNLGIELKTVSG